MEDEAISRAEERLLALFDRVRRIALGENPMADHGVSGPQLTVLQWVAASPSCGIQQIADGLGLAAPTVSVGVRRLEQAGLLERQPDPLDGRAIRLFLTDRGRAIHQQARAFRLEKMRQLLAGLTLEEQETLLALLKRAVDGAELR